MNEASSISISWSPEHLSLWQDLVLAKPSLGTCPVPVLGLMAATSRSDRPTAPGCGSTTSPLPILASTCAAWLAAQGLSRRPPSRSQSHPAPDPPTVSVVNAWRGREEKTLEPRQGLHWLSHPTVAEPSPLAPCPQASGALSSPSTRPVALCSRARMPASSASSMMGQPPYGLSGRPGTRS